MLAGFLKVTAPSSIVLLLKLFTLLLLVMGGGRAGGSFRLTPRVLRSENWKMSTGIRRFQCRRKAIKMSSKVHDF